MTIIILVQVFFGIIIGLYFWNLLKNQRSNKVAVDRESRKELDQLRKLRSISLSEPLNEKTRPHTFKEIIGQKEGIKALKAAICGPNPQHVIIYGPPGVGKTAAARLVLEDAKDNMKSPFRRDAKFVELDATTARFDERGIADPLIGSVHDPIYQGAGAMGQAGIPQPKQGAVTKAHGGLLFIDEIGELHPIQMNKLLKVLEDRKVFLESAYYNEENSNIPSHIHDMFQNGLPADFRMIGATTRTPEEIPPAIRSRCVEIFFCSLKPGDIAKVARRAMEKIQISFDEKAIEVITRYAKNGREAVNLVQIAAGIASTEERNHLTVNDIEWVIHNSQLTPRPEKKIPSEPQIGVINGLAVYGPNLGALLEIEVTAVEAKEEGKGSIHLTGMAEEETMGSQHRSITRKSMAKGSVDNVLTLLRNKGLNPENYNLHVNFPGGTPVDGPSAGISMATAIYSAIKKIKIDNQLAMSGEISIYGKVKPVGGIVSKVEAAYQAGATRVIIPQENYQAIFDEYEQIEVLPVNTFDQVIDIVFPEESKQGVDLPQNAEILTASTT
jgi:Lon-like ATP-dependent protease